MHRFKDAMLAEQKNSIDYWLKHPELVVMEEENQKQIQAESEGILYTRPPTFRQVKPRNKVVSSKILEREKVGKNMTARKRIE